MKYIFKMLKGECWWGGSANDGTEMPFDESTVLTRDFTAFAPNQTMPMYISNKGRCIWSEESFKAEINGGEFIIESDCDVSLEVFGKTLRDAYLGAMKAHFAPVGDSLEREFFRVPQYNTWMQMTYYQSQEAVLKYAHDIVDNGFKPGILMIDEGWQSFYGDWSFDRLKFPDPKGMVDELHNMGFKVMLWVVPYVRADGLQFIKHYMPELCDKNYFLRTENGELAIIHWWNGYSAILDFTKECDRDFFNKQLRALMSDIGIDGFKFDGGTLDDYAINNPVNGRANSDFTPAERNIAWNELGMQYAFHEYKDTFKGGGKRVIQRIRDRGHKWDGDGLSTLIPNATAQGLIGHPFVCPDMVGGGEWTYRELNIPTDKELFVRMAQCSALFPMMQFSWAPWEALDEEHLALVKAAHDMHNAFSEKILRLVDKAECDGEPILRALEYNYPASGYERVNDVFMLGEDILVAPVIVKGQTVREIPLPYGSWRGFDGKLYEGGKTVSIPVTIGDLPFFEKEN